MLNQMLWQLPIGTTILDDGKVRFRVWAPKPRSIALVIKESDQEKVYPLTKTENNYYETILPNIAPNAEYWYLLDGNKKCPDPASRWQPHGVHGPSRLYDPTEFKWSDDSWRGIPLHQYIIYEIHVGTFTPEGTFDGVISRLPYLKDLGITAIEIMPVGEFPGSRNWGYDGVCPYAPHHSYGGPDGLKRLVNAAHQSGLAVILDQFFNHLGPEGNNLQEFGYYQTDRYKTPWGNAINYDGAHSDHVRDYYINNLLYWMNEYHVDAIRMDAIQAIFDLSALHILEEMKMNVRLHAQALGKHLYLIAESDLNDIRVINPKDKGGFSIDAQWSDDFHHSLYYLLTESEWGYFIDFNDLAQFAKALTVGFVYDGRWSQYRNRRFGSSSQDRPGEQFVICIDNHDQIGNAGLGKRLGSLVTLEQFKLASMLLFMAPNIPLMFMGQEWNATASFMFFTSYEDPEIAKWVREGYINEFHYENEPNMADFDPQNEARFLKCKLNWAELEQSEHFHVLHLYKRLIALRKKYRCLSNCRKDLVHVTFDAEQDWLIFTRKDPDGSQALIVANFKPEEQTIEIPFPAGEWKLELSSHSSSTENLLEHVQLPVLKQQSLPIPGHTGLLYIGHNGLEF